MVDRATSDNAVSALRKFAEGAISNREYERRFPKSKDDPALRSIYTNVWFCYSDTSEHTLTDKHALSKENNATLERCVLFLQSDLEFQWPPTKISLWYPLLRLIGLGPVVNRELDSASSECSLPRRLFQLGDPRTPGISVVQVKMLRSHFNSW